MKRSLLIVGHGSKSEDAVDVFNRIIDLAREISDYDFVEGAHMELAEPDVERVVHELNQRNTTEIIIAPYFLYEGMHIKRDIPAIIETLSREYPHIDFKLSKPIGYEPVLADIILKRAQEAV